MSVYRCSHCNLYIDGNVSGCNESVEGLEICDTCDSNSEMDENELLEEFCELEQMLSKLGVYSQK